MNRGKHLFSASVLTILAACAAYDDDFDEYSFDANASYAVPVSENEKPGKTVDELLNMTPRPVHEIGSVAISEKSPEDAVSTPAPAQKTVEARAGRFGSKEKIALRKGLNAPIEEISYTGTSIVHVEIVRPLTLKKPLPVVQKAEAAKESRTEEKQPDVSASGDKAVESREQAFLDEIVASQGVAVADGGQKPPENRRVADAKANAKPSPSEESVLKPPANEKTPQVQETIVLRDPSLKRRTRARETIVLKQPDLPAFEDADDVSVSVPLALIVFSDGKNALTGERAALIQDASEQWKSQQFSRIRVIGYDGGDARKKASERAKKVAEALIKYGVPSSRIVTQTVTGQKPYGAQTGACAELFLEY